MKKNVLYNHKEKKKKHLTTGFFGEKIIFKKDMYIQKQMLINNLIMTRSRPIGTHGMLNKYVVIDEGNL